jgi:hypothetical protein
VRRGRDLDESGHAVTGRSWRRWSAGGALALLAAPSAAQELVRLNGFAFDSVANRPLVGAFVVLDGGRSTRSDQFGAFRFDSVRLGIHELELQHAVLDSMGLSGISSRIVLLESARLAVVAVPSFATLWTSACGDRPAPSDSGFVYGTVRRALDGDEAEGATVRLSWVDLTLVSVREFRQKRFNAEVETDELGQYAICGVPLDTGLEIVAARGDTASAPTSVGTTRRIRRRDLLIGPTDTVSAPRGSVTGVVTHPDGRPFEGATVVLDDAAPQRTGRDGRFGFTGVLTGTRQLEVLAIGARPQVEPVDVRPGTATSVLVTLTRMTTLDVVRVIGTRWQLRMLEELEERMAKPHGQYRDSTFLAGRQAMPAVFAGLRSTSIAMAGRGGSAGDIASIRMGRGCDATVYVDGYREDGSDPPLIWTNRLKPQDIAVMEVYDRPELVPFRFYAQGEAPCGVVAIWTKGVLP